MNERARTGDVIQLDPDAAIGREWGGLLCIVDEAKTWGVKCYVLFPITPGSAPQYVWLRVPHESYRVVGQTKFADWTERSGKAPKESRAQLMARARSLAMYLCGYGYAFMANLMEGLPQELRQKHHVDFGWYRKQVEKLCELNAAADEEAPDATVEE